jgi:hypothetical protein
MLGRRHFLGLAGVAWLARSRLAHAARSRPQLRVVVNDNHPLDVTLVDQVEASRAHTWEVLRRTDLWKHWVPMIVHSESVPRPGKNPAFAAVVDLPWPVLDRNFMATKQLTRGESVDHLRLAYIPHSGNMRDFATRIELRSLGPERTEVRVRVKADFGFRLSKRFIGWLVERKTPEVFNALDRRLSTWG